MGAVYYASAAWCQPCKTVRPTVERIAAKHGHEFVYMDVDEHQEWAEFVGVRGVPTVILVNHGTEIGQLGPTMINAQTLNNLMRQDDSQ